MDGVDRFEDLVTWQLLYRLSVDVSAITRRSGISRDFDFCTEIRDASDSAHRNVAEGFARYSPPQFAQFLDIARGSAAETRALLKKGRALGYLSDAEYVSLDRLANRGLQAMARLQRYLRTPEARRNAERQRHRRNRPRSRPSDWPPNNADVTGNRDPNDPNPNDPNDPNPNDPNDPNPNDPNDPNLPNDPND